MHNATRIPLLLFTFVLLWTLQSANASGQSEGPTDKTRLLMQRIDEYHRLFQNGDYDRAYEMLGHEWATGGKDRKDWNHTTRQMGKGIKTLGWEVKQIWFSGDRAKVHMILRAKVKESASEWKETSEEQDDFWVFEKGSWYFIPIRPGDWDQSKAVEEPVPSARGPLKIVIKEKE